MLLLFDSFVLLEQLLSFRHEYMHWYMESPNWLTLILIVYVVFFTNNPVLQLNLSDMSLCCGI